MASLWGNRQQGGGNSLFDFQPRQQSGTANNIGAISAIISDIGGALGGRQGVGASQQMAEQRQQQEQKAALVQALNSPDPVQRDKAYRFAAMNGMDPERLKAAFEKPQDKFENVGGQLYRIPGAGGLPQLAVAGPKKPAPIRDYESGGNKITEQMNEDGTWSQLATAPRYKPVAAGGGGGMGGGSGGFGGKTADERFMNILLKGDPNTPEYHAAYSYASKPKPSISETGQLVTLKQDLSWARPPMRDGKPYGGPQPTATVGDQVIVPKQTQEQKIASGFADRMGQAELDLSATEDALGDAGQVAKGSVPLVGNFLVSDQYQSADQAKRNWINANLRRESGATIQDEEFANANKQYFVQPGDSDQVKAQKRKNRQIAEEAMRRGSSNVISPQGAPKPPPRSNGRAALPQKPQAAAGWTVKRRD